MEVLIQQLTKNTFKCFVMITILQLQKKRKKTRLLPVDSE